MQEAQSRVSVYRSLAERVQEEAATLRLERDRLQVPIYSHLCMNNGNWHTRL